MKKSTREIIGFVLIILGLPIGMVAIGILLLVSPDWLKNELPPQASLGAVRLAGLVLFGWGSLALREAWQNEKKTRELERESDEGIIRAKEGGRKS